MDNNERIYNGDYVTYQNPNFEEEEICRVFITQLGDNGEVIGASIEKLNKRFGDNGIEEFPEIGEDDPYIFPANPVSIDRINPILISSTDLTKLKHGLIKANLKIEDEGSDKGTLMSDDAMIIHARSLKYVHQLQQELRQILFENIQAISDLFN